MSPINALTLYMRLLHDAEGVDGKLELGRAVARAALSVLQHGRSALHVQRPIVLRSAGLRWSVPAFDNSFASTSPGQDANNVLGEIRELLAGSEGRACLDIGANLGYVAVPLAREFPTHRIVAVEPIAWLAEAITGTVRLNGLQNLAVVQRAIASGASMRLAVPTVGRVRMTTLYANGHAANGNHGRPAEQIDAPAITLDRLIEEQKIDPRTIACVKMDASGHEADALATGPRTLSAKPPVIFEALGTERQLAAEDVLRGFGYTRFAALGDWRHVIATA